MSSRSSLSRTLKRKIAIDLRTIQLEEDVLELIERCRGPPSPPPMDSLPPSTSGTSRSNIASSDVVDDGPLFYDSESYESYESDSECSFSSSTSDLPPFFDDNNCSSELNGISGILTSETDSVRQDVHVNLRDELRNWALTEKIALSSLSRLLKILQDHHPELPVDGRTLLKTPRVDNIQPLAGGSEFVYFGIEKSLCKLDLKKICPNKAVELQINVDGLPISRSSNLQLWPILALVDSGIKMNPFMIACYCGSSKPKSVNSFLDDFVIEASRLSANGFHCQGDSYSFKVKNFVCDAPARAFVKCVKGHNAYFGCEKCTQRGRYVKGRIIFEIESEKRSDLDFLERRNSGHFTGVSPLVDLKVGLVSEFPLEYMHLVCLGIVKKLIIYWVRKGAKGKGAVGNSRLSFTQVEQISQRLLSLRKSIPSEFARKPRSLFDIDRWKATELRQFLLYTGPFVLKKILPSHLYSHFLCLHVAVTILSSPKLVKSERYITYADGLLKSFVEDMTPYYGETSVVYNTHNLVHLSDDVRKFGNLDKFSAFPFENYLGQLKRLIRTGNKQLSQIFRRISEIESNPLATRSSRDSIRHHEIIIKGFRITAKSVKDSCVQLVDGRIVMVEAIKKRGSEECHLVCSELQTSPFYSDPCSSQIVEFHAFKYQRKANITVDLAKVQAKCFVNEEAKFVVVMCHFL